MLESPTLPSPEFYSVRTRKVVRIFLDSQRLVYKYRLSYPFGTTMARVCKNVLSKFLQVRSCRLAAWGVRSMQMHCQKIYLMTLLLSPIQYVIKFSTISFYLAKLYVTQSFATVIYSEIRQNFANSVQGPPPGLNAAAGPPTRTHICFDKSHIPLLYIALQDFMPVRLLNLVGYYVVKN